MGILDGIVEWISEQVMNILDLITTSVLGALGCNMDTFLRYFPAAETLYVIFVATGIGLVLLNWVWQLFRNFGLIAGLEAEDPVKLSIRSIIFICLIYFCDEITDLVLKKCYMAFGGFSSSTIGCFAITSNPCMSKAYCSIEIWTASFAERGHLKVPILILL